MNSLDVEALLSEEGKRFLEKHRDESADRVVMKYHGTVSSHLLSGVAEQLRSQSKLQKKQPHFAQRGALVELSVLEQSTPRAVAEFRKTVMNGGSLCECTGGLGVDTLALSDVFDTVTFCEIDEARALLFKYNSSLFSKENINVITGDSIEFLKKSTVDFDWIFLDPARRDGGGKRFITLDACMPNVLEHAELLRSKARNIGIKLSPAFEISELPSLFPDISQCLAISLDGEVRELFITIENDKEYTGPSAVVLRDSETVSIVSKGSHAVDVITDLPGNSVLFEPDPAIIKARVIDDVAKQFNLQRWSSSGIFLVGTDIIPAFPGRQFRIAEQLQWQRKSVGKYLKKNSITKAAVIRRDFPLKPEELRKMYKLKESETEFLIFTTDHNNQKVCLHVEKWYDER